MKRSFIHFFLAVCALALTASCMKTPQQSSASLTIHVDSLNERDSLGERTLKIAIPQHAGANLQYMMDEWVSEVLGGTFQGNPTNRKALLSHYMKERAVEMQDNYIEMDSLLAPRMEYISDSKIEVLAESSSFITLSCTGFEFWGGAHGSNLFVGQTFRKTDGRRMGWEIFRVDMNDLIRAGLKQYFEVQTDAELMERLLWADSPYLIPLPNCPPLFLKDGVMFVYQNYEIAPYASGQPSFTIGYDVLKNYLNETGKRLVEPLA